MAGGTAPAERLEWVDGAKAIGMVAVAVGHVWWSGPLHDGPYRFHMPLFFLISGYLFSAKPMGGFVRNMGLTLVVPYIAFLLALWGFDMAIEGARGRGAFLGSVEASLWKLVYGGTALRGPFTVFWFPLCLMFARIGYNALCQIAPDPLTLKSVVLAMAIGGLGYVVPMIWSVSPLGLLSVPMAIFLLWAGHAWRRAALPGWWVWGAAVLAIPVMLAGPIINMKVGDYGWPIISIVAAIAISFAIFRVGRVFSFAGSLGRASLVIMYLHVPVIHYIGIGIGRPLLLVLSLAIPLAVWWTFGQFRITERLFLGVYRK